jgi:hypothetical protein
MPVTRTDCDYVARSVYESRVTRAIIAGETVSIRTLMKRIEFPSPHVTMQLLRRMAENGAVILS